MARPGSGRDNQRRARATRQGTAAPSPPPVPDNIADWIRRVPMPGGARRAPPGEAVRLFCFSYAGGGASVFNAWSAAFGDGAGTPLLDVCAIQLPGRETRWGQPALPSLATTVDTLVMTLKPLLADPFAVFGHSYGALLAWEFTRSLRRTGGPLPIILFVSGARAPRLPPKQPIHTLPDELFIRKVQAFGGVPDDALRHPDLIKAVLPALRDDFRLMETHVCDTAEPALPVPISSFGGLDDPTVPVPDVLAWSTETTKAFRTRFFQGDHFFAFAGGSQVPRLIADDIAVSAAALPARPPPEMAA